MKFVLLIAIKYCFFQRASPFEMFEQKEFIGIHFHSKARHQMSAQNRIEKNIYANFIRRIKNSILLV